MGIFAGGDKIFLVSATAYWDRGKATPQHVECARFDCQIRFRDSPVGLAWTGGVYFLCSSYLET